MTAPERKLPRVFCAIDTPDLDRAKALAAAMQKAGCGIKVGLEFFNANGPAGVREITEFYEDLALFLDLKYHDIPNTVAGTMRAIAPLGADYLNVHATGGLAMMRTAREALHEEAENIGARVPRLLGVTILTSLDEAAIEEAGFLPGLEQRVSQLALLARKAGLDGVVCSPHEIGLLRAACGAGFVLMTPGIRPDGSPGDDQKRLMNPAEALQKGATHLVIGRPITQAPDPEAAAMDILASLEGVPVA